MQLAFNMPTPVTTAEQPCFMMQECLEEDQDSETRLSRVCCGDLLAATDTVHPATAPNTSAPAILSAM